MDWLTIAKQLACGTNRRIPHCGNDDSMIVSHGTKGYSAYCFRCKENLFESHGQRSISELLRHKREKEFAAAKAVELPKDYDTKVPEEHAVWFLRCGISYEDARRIGIGWSEYYQRIVLPIWDHGKLVSVQMRAVHPNHKPKYLNTSSKTLSSTLWGFSNKSYMDNNLLIVTEDILSAAKVQLAGYDACSCMGTVLTDARAVKIANHYPRAAIWFDNDEAGRKGARKAARQLSMQGVQVSIIKSEHDPKNHTRDEINDYIRGREEC